MTTTALGHQNATATAFASANLTATAVVTSHFPPFTVLSFYDPLNTKSDSDWSSGSPCQASTNGFQVSIAQVNTFEYCSYLPATFGEFALQTTMTIQQGDCAGLIFRHVDNQNMFYYEVCQNGKYNFGELANGKWSYLYSTDHSSSSIQTGLNTQNVLAITVQGDTVNMYVNGQKIDTAQSTDLTSSKFAKGDIALVASDITNSTTVIYSKAMVWTQ